jgi:hypothetical protein
MAALTREIGLLRTRAKHLVRRPLPVEEMTEKLLRREGLGRVRDKADGIVAIRMPGHNAFTELANCLLVRKPGPERGFNYVDIQTDLFNFIEDDIGREPSTIGSTDAEMLLAYCDKQFSERISPRHIFIPCAISRPPAPQFEVGPVTFKFIDRVSTPRGNLPATSSEIGHASYMGLGQRQMRGIDRKGMEGFVTTVLRTAVIELEAHAQSLNPIDEIGEFLTSVRLRKAGSANPGA